MIAKIGRITLRVFLIVLLLLVIIDLILGRVVNFRMDDTGLKTFFHDRKLEPHIGYYQSRGRGVRYLEVGDQSKATVLFIHGAPSSLSYWKGYLSDTSLLHRASLYAVDRPGYGYSGLGDPLPDIATQASILKLVLDSLHKAHHPIVVVGVSFGAPIASRLAMDYPELVDGLVLVAPPLGPGLERIFWFTYLVENPLIHWLVPPMLKSANREKVHHYEELTKMLPLWPLIHVPVIYLQGMEDGLVSTSNAGFAKAHLINASSLDIRMIPGRGHLIAFNERERIAGAIREMLDTCMRKKDGNL
ncbi:MAG: alpha/beta hydrolase [Bacteroidota bacterium]